MKKILCPTDFSDTADKTVAYAAKLCKKIDAELTLLNVQSVFSFPVEEVMKGKYLATKSVREQLDKQCYQVADVFKISCLAEVETSNSSLSHIIAQRGEDFDLIVMGTNGADDYYQFFFGTRSYLVAKKSSVPVLLIPSDCSYRDISVLVFAFDYERERRLPIKQLINFTNLIEAKITVLQVKKHYSRAAEVASNEIQERTKALYHLSNIAFETIFSDEVSESINEHVIKAEADALALCSVQHSLIEDIFNVSVIKTLSAKVSYPIFIFHE